MIAEGEQIQHEPWRSLQRRVAPSVREDLDHALDRRLKESLEALKAYLMTTITRRDEAVAFLRMLGPVRALCNTDIYELPMAAEAYAYTHFPTRYVRWWKVLHLLFQSGWLPMRQDGINAMDVGSGPAPATYALIDFLASLGEAVSTTPRNLGAQRLRTDTPRLTLAEKSRTMGHLVHLLSEHRTLAGPYHISVPDFFGVRLIRTKERNAETRQELINELMSDWDDMAYEEASFILKEEYPNWHEPARFHLCMVSYLLTTEGALNLAGQALNELKRTLPPRAAPLLSWAVWTRTTPGFMLGLGGSYGVYTGSISSCRLV